MNSSADRTDGRSRPRAEETAALLAGGLDQVAEAVGNELGVSRHGQELRDRAEKVRADRFKVLVVGEFKRGKSTLLNAMLGDDIMPRKAAECTAVVTTIQYAEGKRARVVFSDGRPDESLGVDEFRERYESTIEDSSDRQAALDRFSQVERAELYYPVDLCRHRVELVDSPGLGAHKTRSERTQKFLPQGGCRGVRPARDAVPQGGREPLPRSRSCCRCGLRNIFFVINWYNLIESGLPKEVARDKAELEAHIRTRLTPFCVIDGKDRSAERIFRVNAFDALKARMMEPVDAAMLAKSDVPAFERSLQNGSWSRIAPRPATTRPRSLLRTRFDEVNRFIGAQESATARRPRRDRGRVPGPQTEVSIA